MPLVVFTYIKDRDNIGVIEGGCRAGFALKTTDNIFPFTALNGPTQHQFFERYFTSQTNIFGQIDQAHSPSPDLLDDLVFGENDGSD